MKATEPIINASQTDSSNTTEVEDQEEIHVETEEKVPQQSNEAVVDDAQQETSVEPSDQLSYSIYPATCDAWLDDPSYNPMPAFYNPAMSENPPYYPYDARFCPHQSESSTDDFAHQLADSIFGVRFYYH